MELTIGVASEFIQTVIVVDDRAFGSRLGAVVSTEILSPYLPPDGKTSGVKEALTTATGVETTNASDVAGTAENPRIPVEQSATPDANGTHESEASGSHSEATRDLLDARQLERIS